MGLTGVTLDAVSDSGWFEQELLTKGGEVRVSAGYQ